MAIRYFSFALLSFALCTLAFTQVNTATISGTVHDCKRRGSSGSECGDSESRYGNFSDGHNQ